jgi:MoxR-like ATPase
MARRRTPFSVDSPSIEEFGDLFEPDEAVEPILARPVRNALMDWITEIFAEEELAKVGIKARRRAIFDGPPGVGKTTLAHHLAARLGLPMIAVRPERLIDCWVGSSGRNIGDLFDAAAFRGERKEPPLLLLDEFDAIAPKRRAVQQSADQERNQWVNTLLQRIEQHEGFLIAATNFGGEIDAAVWRRFHIQITLDLPGQVERERILARYLAPFGLPSHPLKLLAEAFETASPALMREWCEGLKRQLVIGPKVGWNMHREAVIERLISSIAPHPELGKPRLWTHGAQDAAVRAMPWPLSTEPIEAESGPAEGENVISVLGRKPSERRKQKRD